MIPMPKNDYQMNNTDGLNNFSGLLSMPQSTKYSLKQREPNHTCQEILSTSLQPPHDTFCFTSRLHQVARFSMLCSSLGMMRINAIRRRPRRITGARAGWRCCLRISSESTEWRWGDKWTLEASAEVTRA
jgi:hypothetical protein